MNKFEIFVQGKLYPTKLDKLKDCFLEFGEITARDLLFAPFWYNCAYSAMRNLSKYRGISFYKDDFIKNGVKICEIYKLGSKDDFQVFNNLDELYKDLGI